VDGSGTLTYPGNLILQVYWSENLNTLSCPSKPII
jgi:hypothetical protein